MFCCEQWDRLPCLCIPWSQMFGCEQSQIPLSNLFGMLRMTHCMTKWTHLCHNMWICMVWMWKCSLQIECSFYLTECSFKRRRISKRILICVYMSIILYTLIEFSFERRRANAQKQHCEKASHHLAGARCIAIRTCAAKPRGAESIEHSTAQSGSKNWVHGCGSKTT